MDEVADPDSGDHALVRSIISLGKTLDLRVVAGAGPVLRYS